MNIMKIIRQAGGELISTAFPHGDKVVRLINSVLPEGYDIGMTSTGDDLDRVVKNMPQEIRSEIMMKEIDLLATQDTNQHATWQALAVADSKGSSNRPNIANRFSWLMVFQCIAFNILFAYIVSKSTDPMASFMSGWPLIAAQNASIVAVVWAYFGLRTKEKKERYKAAFGIEPNGGIFNELLSNWKNK